MATFLPKSTATKPDLLRQLKSGKLWRESRKLASSLRVRIAIGYLLLMLLSATVSIFAIRHLLYEHLERRIDKELDREVKEFQKQIDAGTGKDLVGVFRNFTDRQATDNCTYLLLDLDRSIARASNNKLPEIFHLDADRLADWQKLEHQEYGEIQLTASSIIYYSVVPVRLQTERAKLVVLFDATGECQEILDAIAIIKGVSAGALVGALLLVWLASNQILTPLRAFANTARSIGDTDLDRRIPTVGTDDEIAEIALAFNEMLERLQSAFESQKEFLNHLGHELRTPLTVIRVNLELLSEDPQERHQTLAIVADEIERMNRYVNDTIVLSKSERPDFLILKPVNLTSLTQEIFTKAQALGDRQWQLEKIGQGTIVCDRHRITQAVMNLVQNATQQTEIGSTISIGSLMVNGKAKFWVRDTGAGIDPSIQNLIFERFIRCPTNRHRFEGMGLGLAIVKAIARAHSGRVEVQSKVNFGSTFFIIIPIDPPHEYRDLQL